MVECRHHVISALVAVAVVAGLTGCGSDDESSTPTSAATIEATDDTDTTGDTETTATGDAVTTLSSEEICARLSAASVGTDLGLDIVVATPDDSSTPQCAYEYASDGGGTSNLTVAAMRPDDVGGLTGADAFDFVVDINRTVAGDGAEEQTVNAGDDAIRLTGAALHAGIVRVGDRVYIAIVPVGDAEADGVERLIGTMATALA